MHRLCAFVSIALIAGCRFDPSGLAGDDGGRAIDAANPGDGSAVADARTDAPPGTPDAAVPDAMEPDATPACVWPHAPLHFDPCDLPSGTTTNLLVPGIYVYDTDTGVLTDPGTAETTPPSVVIPQQGQEARVWSVTSLTIGNTTLLRVVGARPLIIAADTTIVVNGTVDVSSNFTGAGAGAKTDCGTASPTAGAPAAGTGSTQGGGGGGGGGFRGTGGDGGTGNGAAKGAKGDAVPLPVELRGGCAGANGGASQDSGSGGGGGGAGGGGVELAARISVSISGLVQAGGARGSRGLQGNGSGGTGGGGAGSGGMIYIDTASLDLLGGAILAANGGGGAEGGDNNEDGGVNAQDGQASANAASKGSGGANKGGDGSNGSAGGTINATNAQNNESGGGGGGGAGFIVFHTGATSRAGGIVISPADQSQ